MKIERPDWQDLFLHAGMNIWFDTHVEPINKLLSEGVEVKGNITPTSNQEPYNGYDFNGGTLGKTDPTHKALLINIEPIKQETREQQLENCIRSLLTCATSKDPIYTQEVYMREVEKAKALLELSDTVKELMEIARRNKERE